MRIADGTSAISASRASAVQPVLVVHRSICIVLLWVLDSVFYEVRSIWVVSLQTPQRPGITFQIDDNKNTRIC